MNTAFRRKTLVPALVLASALGLQGCAAGLGMTLLGVGASTGASAGVSHTLSGITYKTFTAPSHEVHAAARNAMGTMGIAIEKDAVADGEDGIRTLVGKTNDRDIDVEIEEVTPRTTRLRVVASHDLLFKDSATATEIIMQTGLALDTMQAAKARLAAARAIKASATRKSRK